MKRAIAQSMLVMYLKSLTVSFFEDKEESFAKRAIPVWAEQTAAAESVSETEIRLLKDILMNSGSIK